jgi:transcriptional regulator with XRE-family HTH domain
VVGCSPATLSRLERGLIVDVSLELLARVAAVVGLDLSVRTFPGGQRLKDTPQMELLEAFRGRVRPGVPWRTEVGVPIPGDQRRWDAMIGREWRYGIEAESAPRDWQALAGRLELKRRDSGIDGVILVLPETRRTREFLAAAAPFISSVFPIPARLVLKRLANGLDPGGSGIVVLRVASHARVGGRVAAGVSMDDRSGAHVAPGGATDDGAVPQSPIVIPAANHATEEAFLAPRATK